MGPSIRISSWVAAALAASIIVGCGTNPTTEASPIVATSATETLAATAVASSTATPTPAPATPSPVASYVANAPPTELRGIWTTFIGADRTSLTLIPGFYKVARAGAGGGGKITVTGDVIEFFGSNLCEGSGSYRWVVEGDRLTLAPITADPCGRASALANVTYTRYAAIP